MRLPEIKKIEIGIYVIPETYDLFRKMARFYQSSVSMFLAHVIHMYKDDFEYYNVDPAYGERTDATKQTIFIVTEENKELLNSWAQREKCSLSSILRCLIDTVVKIDTHGKVDLDKEYDDEPELHFFKTCSGFELPLDEIIDERLKAFQDENIKKLLQSYNGDGKNLLDGEFEFTEKQKAILERLAKKNKLSLDAVILAFKLSVYYNMIETKPRNCHVIKKHFIELKYLCQKIGSTPSKLLEENVNLLWAEEYHTPGISPDEELLRVNVILSALTMHVINQFCREQHIKTAEAIRRLTGYIYNFYIFSNDEAVKPTPIL